MGMVISYTRFSLIYLFFWLMRMKINLYKHNEVEMEVTRHEPTSLSSLPFLT